MSIGILFVHTAAVETFLGAGPTGDTYAAEVEIPCFFDEGLVRVQTAGGEALVQRSTLYAPLSALDTLKPESNVRVNGRIGQVDSVRRRDGGALFSAVNHLEVDLK